MEMEAGRRVAIHFVSVAFIGARDYSREGGARSRWQAAATDRPTRGGSRRHPEGKQAHVSRSVGAATYFTCLKIWGTDCGRNEWWEGQRA